MYPRAPLSRVTSYFCTIHCFMLSPYSAALHQSSFSGQLFFCFLFFFFSVQHVSEQWQFRKSEIYNVLFASAILLCKWTVELMGREKHVTIFFFPSPSQEQVHPCVSVTHRLSSLSGRAYLLWLWLKLSINRNNFYAKKNLSAFFPSCAWQASPISQGQEVGCVYLCVLGGILVNTLLFLGLF